MLAMFFDMFPLHLCCVFHRFTKAEVQQLVEKRRLAGNNNTSTQYDSLRKHLVVSVALLTHDSCRNSNCQLRTEHAAGQALLPAFVVGCPQ